MFYIKPPAGQTPLDILENCVLARVEYLELVHQNNIEGFKGRFEYLLENTIHDKIGHFVLRLLAATHPNLMTHWINREVLLFVLRLKHILPKQVHRLFRSILNQIRLLIDKDKMICKTLEDICMFYLTPEILRHILETNHPEDCDMYQLKVRYKMVPELIRTRKTDLSNGYAIILCSQWKQLLQSLFHTYLTNETAILKSKAQKVIESDIRFQILHQRIHSKSYENTFMKGGITIKNIEAEKKNFPLCMQHLHTMLRTTHRLSHYARLYYGLFLKDVGMLIEDAIHLWKEEYSKPHHCNAGCTHNWQSDEKKFLYSIRHLYGLEGSRKQYKSYDCNHLCMSQSTKYEGGCPFHNFDTIRLRNLLQHSLTTQECEDFLQVISSKKPQYACKKYFSLIHKGNMNNVSIDSPVQYYFLTQD